MAGCGPRPGSPATAPFEDGGAWVNDRVVLGAVPRSPIPPVVKGESLGSTALPSSASAIGAPSTVGAASDLLVGAERALTGQYSDTRSSVAHRRPHRCRGR